MSSNEKPLIIVDIDLTIYDSFANPPKLIEGSRLLLEALSQLGEVHLWSAGGEAYAKQVATKFELTDLITDYHNKPDYPPSEGNALKILGRAAALQIDDDPTERVGDWPFIQATAAQELYES